MLGNVDLARSPLVQAPDEVEALQIDLWVLRQFGEQLFNTFKALHMLKLVLVMPAGRFKASQMFIWEPVGWSASSSGC